MSLTYGFCLGADDAVYSSAEFSEAFHQVFGDGVTPYGSRFALQALSGLTLNIGTGFALVHGQWVESDEPIDLTLQPADNYDNRYDAIALKVDYATRSVSLSVLTGVDPAAPPRDDNEYCVYLYTVFVARGETVLEQSNITDTRGDPALCGYITPLEAIAGDVQYIYQFLTSGIDEEVARLIAKSEGVIQNSLSVIEALDKKIMAASNRAIGDTMVSLSRPDPAAEWLLCDGSAVSAEYPELSALLGGTLPLLTAEDERYLYWIYAGTPDN